MCLYLEVVDFLRHLEKKLLWIKKVNSGCLTWIKVLQNRKVLEWTVENLMQPHLIQGSQFYLEILSP